MFDYVLNASLEYGHMKKMKKEKGENSQLYLRLEKLLASKKGDGMPTFAR